jgi:hypothetical protein
MERFVFLLVILVALGAAVDAGWAVEPADDLYFCAVLDAERRARAGGPYELLDRLDEMERESPDYPRLIVGLTDYVLDYGEHSHVFDEYITPLGHAVLPLIEAKLKTSLDCLPEYRDLCQPSLADRNSVLFQLIDMIEKGIVECTWPDRCACRERRGVWTKRIKGPDGKWMKGYCGGQ